MLVVSHSLIDEANPGLQGVCETVVSDDICSLTNHLRRCLQEPAGVTVRAGQCDEVERGESCLLAVTDIDDDLLLGGHVLDVVKDLLLHGEESGFPVILVEAVDVDVEVAGAGVGVEVECVGGLGTDPLGHLTVGGDAGRKPDQLDLVLELGGDETHAGGDDLEDGVVFTEEMQLICDEKPDLREDLLGLPTAGKDVPVLGDGQDQVVLLDDLLVDGLLPRQHPHGDVEQVVEPGENFQLLAEYGCIGGNVDDLG